MQTSSRFALRLVSSLMLGVVLLLGPLSAHVRASCVPEQPGTCNGHPECDPTDKKKHCRDTLTNSGYVCRCRTGADQRTHHAHSTINEASPHYLEHYQAPQQPSHGTQGSGEGSATPPPPNDQTDSAPKNTYEKPPEIPSDQNTSPH